MTIRHKKVQCDRGYLFYNEKGSEVWRKWYFKLCFEDLSPSRGAH